MERIQIDDFSQVKMLSQLQASPSGEKLAFVVTQAQVKANKYVSHIHLLENGKVRKLTGGGAEKSLYWLDEEHILFPGCFFVVFVMPGLYSAFALSRNGERWHKLPRSGSR